MIVPTNVISVPISAYLTLDRFKEKVEENYRYKRQDTLVPKDPSKKILFVIDDIHHVRNLQLDLLEYFRSWCLNKGYYDTQNGYFKNIGQFGTIMAENIKYQSTSNKHDRFSFYVNSIYTEEIGMDKFKHFVSTWLTAQWSSSEQWQQSEIMIKYYVLTVNALISLLDKMKLNKQIINASSFSKLYKFHFVSKFCSNLVFNAINTETKSAVYGLGYEFN